MRQLLVVLLTIAFCLPVEAIDINPSKERLKPARAPRPYLFQGDPRRVERANTVQLRDVDLRLSVVPGYISSGGNMEVTLSVFNKSRRPIMLLFPDTQRLEVAVVDAAGDEVFLLSASRNFELISGTTVINPRERAVYTTTIPASGWTGGVRAGSYRVVGAVAGYPHVQASGDIIVR